MFTYAPNISLQGIFPVELTELSQRYIPSSSFLKWLTILEIKSTATHIKMYLHKLNHTGIKKKKSHSSLTNGINQIFYLGYNPK